jgi:hypothetical protein
MLAIRTQFDGKEIHLPEEAQGLPPGNVIVLFEDERHVSDSDWLKIQEQAMAGAWDDEEDSIYDEA